jgi:hypothetical protein
LERAGSPRALTRAPSPSIYELKEFGKEFKTEQGIPKLLKKYECPRLGSRVTVLGLEDLRDSAYNSECGTIVGERNGRWVVSLDFMEHGATLLLKPENVRHILPSVYIPKTPDIPAKGDCSTPGFIRVGRGSAILRGPGICSGSAAQKREADPWDRGTNSSASEGENVSLPDSDAEGGRRGGGDEDSGRRDVVDVIKARRTGTVLENGSRVKIERLKHATHLNGTLATVTAAPAGQERVNVLLIDGTERAVKRENLVLVQGPEGGFDKGGWTGGGRGRGRGGGKRRRRRAGAERRERF